MPLPSRWGHSYGRQWASVLGAILGQVGQAWQADRLAVTGDGGNVGTIPPKRTSNIICAHQILSAHTRGSDARNSRIVNFCNNPAIMAGSVQEWLER